MANNVMFLVNRITGARVKLAKYYPTTGWYVYDPSEHPLIKRLNAAFDEVLTRNLLWGDADWQIQYDMEDERKETAH